MASWVILFKKKINCHIPHLTFGELLSWPLVHVPQMALPSFLVPRVSVQHRLIQSSHKITLAKGTASRMANNQTQVNESPSWDFC